MEITGIVKHISQIKDGVSKTGNPWESLDFVLETKTEYPETFVIGIYGQDKDGKGFQTRAFLEKVKVGAELTASVNGRANEYNGKWYGQLSMWKFDIKHSASVPPDNPSSTPVPEIPADGEGDPLPF
jgi:hypothetical protein